MTRPRGPRSTSTRATPPPFTGLALILLLGACMLVTLGAAVPGGFGTGPGPTLPAITAGTAPASDQGRVSGAAAGMCEEHERPREGVGHTHVRLRCTISDTRPLKTPDDLTQPYLDDRRARAAVHPRGHDGRPRAARIRAVGDTTVLLQVFRR